MAYSINNPPQCIAQAIAGPSHWLYKSDDAYTAVQAANYFTNGKPLGMKVGDLVSVLDTDSDTATIHQVTEVTDSGATVSQATLGGGGGD